MFFKRKGLYNASTMMKGDLYKPINTEKWWFEYDWWQIIMFLL